MTSVTVQRDNLGAGIYLGAHGYGVGLDDVLAYGLGYNPNGTYPTNDRPLYERRFREAQQVGNEKYAKREPGYFTFHAQPFGGVYVYKTVWYVWRNPQSGINQAVLIADTDIQRMRDFREKDLHTRARNVRAVQTADNVQQYREAVSAGDLQRAYNVLGRFRNDGTLGELLTSQLGISYADIAPVLEQIAQGNPFNQLQFSFTKTAAKIRKLQADLEHEMSQLVSQLTAWINIVTGLPQNARALALQDAAQRYSQIP